MNELMNDTIKYMVTYLKKIARSTDKGNFNYQADTFSIVNKSE